MKSPRTLLSLVLFIPLAAILLTTFACLPVPIGDPEKSKVDPALVGIYQFQASDPADKNSTIAILKPWDDKTYILDYLTIETRNEKEDCQYQQFKCWLTTLAGKTFITCQLMDNRQFGIGDQDKKPVWPVLRIDKAPSGLELRMVNADSEFLKGRTTQEEFEASIKAHVSDNDLYGNPATFKKLGPEAAAFIEATLAKVGIR
jgi:hypothetical protein